MTIRAFGPLSVTIDGRPATLRGKPAAFLALLACFPGRTVSHRLTIDALWDPAAPPADPARAIRQVLRRLQAELPEGVIVATSSGHRLDLERVSVDVATCQLLLRGTDHDQLRAGLALWTGDPFTEIAHVPEVQIEIEALTASRLVAIESLCETQLRSGAGYPLVAELERLVTLYPRRERLWQLLAMALHRCSRRVDALRTFDRCRAALAGASLSPATRRIEQALLLDELDLAG